MKVIKYYRKGSVIRGANGDMNFRFINEAKRKSRELQLKEDGAMGLGSLRVVSRLPSVAQIKKRLEAHEAAKQATQASASH